LFYHGKENAVYGETEAGKDMLLAELTRQSAEFWAHVAWIDFEEGTEVDAGRRLLELGMEPDVLDDRDLFRFATPSNVEEARDAIYDAIKWRADIIILNGIQAAFVLFGWDLNDPDSARYFRQVIVLPCLKAGCTIIETDHIPKEDTKSKGNGGRYAYGGVMKLNWVNGAAYLLRARATITRGKKGKPGKGNSDLILTKDRPGMVKPGCVRIKDEARTMYAGTLNVESIGWKGRGKLSWQDFDLRVDVTPPYTKTEYDVPARELPDKQTMPKAKSQARIYKIISEAGRPMTPAEITDALNQGLTVDDEGYILSSAVKMALRRGRDNGVFIDKGDGRWDVI
jgi:hypothetical protein